MGVRLRGRTGTHAFQEGMSVLPRSGLVPVLSSASVAKNICIFHSHELLSPKVLDLEMVASVVKNPTTIRVTLLRGRALSEWALWLLLNGVHICQMSPNDPVA